MLSALEELFQTGVTSLLPRSQPVVDPNPAPIEDVRGRVLFPTARELADIALGVVEPPRSASAMALELRVEHGDLRFADLPIIVGHIMGTPLRGAELTLDRISDGVISSARRLGVYAGDAGTSQLFRYFRGGEGHVCAVVNMGEIGEFTPTVLREGVADACLRLVSIRLPEAQRSQEQINLGIAPVLIGAGTGGLSVDDSLSAIIEGVITANRRLVDQGLIDHIRVARIQVTEAYEGLAIAAQRAALRLAEQYGEEGSQEGLIVAPYILVGAYPKRGQPDPVYHEGEWRTITVEAVRPATDTTADGSDELVDLVFTSVGARAARRAGRVVEPASTDRAADRIGRQLSRGTGAADQYLVRTALSASTQGVAATADKPHVRARPRSRPLPLGAARNQNPRARDPARRLPDPDAAAAPHRVRTRPGSPRHRHNRLGDRRPTHHRVSPPRGCSTGSATGCSTARGSRMGRDPV